MILDTPEQKPHIFYEGDETMPDLATWRENQHNLTKARWKIIEQQKTIKSLNLKVSRLLKRLSKAESSNNLKKNLPAEQAHGTILVNLIFKSV